MNGKRRMSKKDFSFNQAKRLVVKIGSHLLFSEENNTPRYEWLESLAKDIMDLRLSNKCQVIIVSSGAIALGCILMGRKRLSLLTIEEKQALASIGQGLLLRLWEKIFSRHSIKIGQILLTLDDSEDRRRYLNTRGTVDALLKMSCIPIINENDTIATKEIRFGDNDRLASRIAQMVSADTMVLLSTVDGLYDRDPEKFSSARHIDRVYNITPRIEAMAGINKTNYGSGGMSTKLQAAKISMDAGCHMVICDGRINHPLSKILRNEIRGTWFIPSKDPMRAHKKWLSGLFSTKGDIMIDKGAAQALLAGKSLLPAGVIDISGNFFRGDVVVIKSKEGHNIGKGLCAFSSHQARLIKGKKSNELENILGFKGRSEMIHRDYMVLSKDKDVDG